MISLVVLQLLTFEPTESYSGLAPPQLLEKRRMLAEERPGIAAPITVSAAGLFPLAGGTTLILLNTLNNGRCGYEPGWCAGGGVLAFVGVAAITFGIIWLIQRLGVRSAIAARVDEINDLLELKRQPVTAPP
jgi:hypothetical protein